MSVGELIISIACFLIYAFTFDSARKKGEDTLSGNHTLRYRPSLDIPNFYLILTIFSVVTLGITDPTSAVRELQSLCFDLLFCSFVYYLLFLPFLPLLQKHVWSRTRITLWLLPSSIFFLSINTTKEKPQFVLRLPELITEIAFPVWCVGFVSIMIWSIVSHFVFRHRILQDSKPVTDPDILQIFHSEATDADLRFKAMKNPILTSPHVKTPLSIGWFRSTIRVVLPQRAYTPKELVMIFRHEILHIGRKDSLNKFTLLFFRALCWFNPLMWIAMRRCADDLELSCDEAVLLDTDDAFRREYADLLLQTAGDERGFTTCLSASAESLRFRLKNVVTPHRNRTCGFLAGIAVFVLMMGCGNFALAIEEGTGADFFFPNGVERYTLSIRSNGEDDAAELKQYLSELEFYEITGDYYLLNCENRLEVQCTAEEYASRIHIQDQYIEVTIYRGNAARDYALYYCPEPLDWEYIRSLISAAYST